MSKLVLTAIALFVLVIVGAGAFLMFWNIPAPSAHIERVIPDARFPR